MILLYSIKTAFVFWNNPNSWLNYSSEKLGISIFFFFFCGHRTDTRASMSISAFSEHRRARETLRGRWSRANIDSSKTKRLGCMYEILRHGYNAIFNSELGNSWKFHIFFCISSHSSRQDWILNSEPLILTAEYHHQFGGRCENKSKST